MIPWVREKLAESRLRWQNRKQRNDVTSLIDSPSNHINIDNSTANRPSPLHQIPIAAVREHATNNSNENQYQQTNLIRTFSSTNIVADSSNDLPLRASCDSGTSYDFVRGSNHSTR